MDFNNLDLHNDKSYHIFLYLYYMQKHHNIIIAGAGGIAEAVALILAEWSEVKPTVFIGNRTIEKAEKIAELVKSMPSNNCKIEAFKLSTEEVGQEMKSIFEKGDIVLDCLPGSLAPKIAGFAKDFNLHYANLTEYVAETDQIIGLAKDANTGFILQTGLAPGYIGVLAHHLFLRFCKDYHVEKTDKLEFKVGALTDHAVAPHYYGFTWSAVGVATEYIKDAVVLRDYKKTTVPALSEKSTIIINGIAYEDDLTSGGAADLPDALAGKVKNLDYKTLRYPGHYDWVKQQVHGLDKTDKTIKILQQKMEAVVPHIEDDQIVLYAAVEGKDSRGILRRRERAKIIRPQKIGKHLLRAIQTTTAAPMVQAAQLLLETDKKGVVLQSQLDTGTFLNGGFVSKVYGEVFQ